MSALFVVFHKNISAAAIERLTREFNTLEWAQAFIGNAHVYGVWAPDEQADAWKDAIAQLPEVELVERVRRGIRLVPDHAT